MELNANMLTLATSQRDAFNLKRVDKKNNLSIFTRQEKNWLLFFSALLPQSSTQGPQPPTIFFLQKYLFTLWRS